MTALLEARESRGVTRTWLATQLGISKTSLWRYERGDIKTPKSILFMSAHLLNIDPNKLI